ncbi:ABC transporter ATP-binding protein [Clostridium sp. C8]|jgi:putative ABC transport system ATP-binding protein|uniref:Putative hemin import ATP-binding protein HrtA n=1 Tax=bioreactor metagenome TaxID=1076179 RepID=A0A644WN15_9ZZZZ|nr:ABC transporter ATP-binding protein [Clostridium sp. C8]KLE14254.1 hemin ABC transporter ATP-binding protein [Clostridium sp. C8]
MSEYALQLNNITKKYNDGESENIVLKDISLNVKHGEFVAIVGPSGSGKSTLLSIAGMLLSPNSGEIVLNGKCLSDEKQKNWTKIRRKQIGFIFQNHQLLPYLTVEDQLKLVKNMNKKVSLDVNETLKELGLKDCAKKYPSNMSGGEKQRIAIARAFMNNPDVILADEPTASLDGTRGRQVVEMIKKEVMKHNKAAVMVTHDERILDLVDVIYRMDKGVLVRDN